MRSCIIFVFVVLLITTDIVYTGEIEDEGYCFKKDGVTECVSAQQFNLTRLDGGQVGDVRPIVLKDGRTLQLKTANNKPLVFEIQNFLSDEECDHFISVAQKIGMEKSHTERQANKKGLQLMDLDHDRLLNLAEMKLTIENGFDIYLEDEDVIEMYHLLHLDTNNDNLITETEMRQISPREMGRYLQDYVTTRPEKHSRYSTQAWLYPDQSTDSVFKELQKRVSQVVQLPMSVILISDFQVVNYGIKGHYDAHLDSSEVKEEVICCDRGRVKDCRICRYMTVLFYLNNVEDGGDTAFPYANRESINLTKSHLEREQHLYKRCEDVPFRVSAEKGKAVIWYNHFVDEETGWMGDIDPYTMHGGCPVIAGEKWIANFWIKTTNDKSQDLKKMQNVLKN